MKNLVMMVAFAWGMSFLAAPAEAFESEFASETCIERTGHGMSFASQAEAHDGAIYVATNLCEARGRQEGHPASYREFSSACEQKLSHDGTKYYWDCTTSGDCCW
jgi:hypothetical protein